MALSSFVFGSFRRATFFSEGECLVGDEADGESADGESADGESADGESTDGYYAERTGGRPRPGTE
jgi:hypothetical protein